MISKLTNAEVAWCAGLFEGEGCITLGGNCPRLQVNMTDKDVLDKFHALIGLGRLTGPHGKGSKYPNAKPYWVWRCSGAEQPQAILTFFWGWLGARRKQRAKEVLSVCWNSPIALQVLNREKTLCFRGHEFKVVRTTGRRYCPTCRNAARRIQGGRGPYKLERQFETELEATKK